VAENRDPDACVPSLTDELEAEYLFVVYRMFDVQPLYCLLLESKLNASHSRFQKELSELPEPCSSPGRVTVPLLERKEHGFNH
jgi:hypothetical protein